MAGRVDSKAIAQLFARLSQEIEEHQPKNCVHFIVDFLCKHYPEHLHGFAAIWQMDPDLERDIDLRRLLVGRVGCRSVCLSAPRCVLNGNVLVSVWNRTVSHCACMPEKILKTAESVAEYTPSTTCRNNALSVKTVK